MKTVPKMKTIIEELTNKHGVDIHTPRARLQLEITKL